PVGEGFASINVALRKKFELYANFRPIRNLPHIPTRYPDVDLIIVRENTESLYSGIEHEVVPGVMESLKIITEKASTRIARFAFDYARRDGRKKIHAVHKANIMKLTDGLFLRCCRDTAEIYPDIQYAEHIVDNTCMQLAVLMLRHIGEIQAGERMQAAIEQVYSEGTKTTRDVGGKAGTTEFADAVIAALETSKEPVGATR